MSEKSIEKIFQEKIKFLGGLAIKFQSPLFTGIPDRIVLMPKGKIFFVELEEPDGRLSSRQKIVFLRLRKMGFEVVVIRDEFECDYFLNRIQNEF